MSQISLTNPMTPKQLMDGTLKKEITFEYGVIGNYDIHHIDAQGKETTIAMDVAPALADMILEAHNGKKKKEA